MITQIRQALFTSLIFILFAGVTCGVEEFIAPNVNVKVTLDPHPRTEDDLQITFTIINFGADSIPYECSLEPHGLDFHLFDDTGKEIPVEKNWFAFNSPRNPNKVSGRFCKLNPGEQLKYVLSLNQAFASRWKGASQLKIEWLPTSHPGAPALLSASYSLGKLFDGNKAIGVNNKADTATRVSDAKTRPAAITSANTGSGESVPVSENVIQHGHSSVPLSIALILIAAMLGLLWLLLKRRS